MKLNKKFIAAFAATALILTTIAGAIAYYVASSNTVENTFTIIAGNGAGEIVEPSWNPDDAKNLQPGDTIPKDPYLAYTGDYDSWVFMTVKVPTISATLNGTEGVYDAVVLGSLGSGWSLIKSSKSQTAGTDSVYYYAYGTVLSSGDNTTSLFTEFTVQPFSDIGSGNFTASIDVSAKVYQAKTADHDGYTQAEAQAEFLE